MNYTLNITFRHSGSSFLIPSLLHVGNRLSLLGNKIIRNPDLFYPKTNAPGEKYSVTLNLGNDKAFLKFPVYTILAQPLHISRSYEETP